MRLSSAYTPPSPTAFWALLSPPTSALCHRGHKRRSTCHLLDGESQGSTGQRSPHLGRRGPAGAWWARAGGQAGVPRGRSLRPIPGFTSLRVLAWFPLYLNFQEQTGWTDPSIRGRGELAEGQDPQGLRLPAAALTLSAPSWNFPFPQSSNHYSTAHPLSWGGGSFPAASLAQTSPPLPTPLHAAHLPSPLPPPPREQIQKGISSPVMALPAATTFHPALSAPSSQAGSTAPAPSLYLHLSTHS